MEIDVHSEPKPFMTHEWVEAAVAYLKTITGDFERAHSFEDNLHQTVLKSIAKNKCESPSLCARLALESQNIEFERYCA